MKCVDHLTELDFMETCLEFFKTENRQLNAMKQATNQPCCKAINVNLAYYNVKETCSRIATARFTASYLYKSQF